MTVNMAAKGDLFVELDEGGTLFIKTEDLDTLNLKYDNARAVLIHGDRYVPVDAVLDVTPAFDEKKLALSFIGKTTESQQTTADVFQLHIRPQNVYYPRETSAFLNYGLSYGYTSPIGGESFSVTNKVGGRTGDVFFVSDSLYTKTDSDKNFVRLQSNVTYERRDDLQWLTLGDQFARSSDLGSTVNMGGIGFSKVYKLDPYFITQPVFDLKGSVIYPTQADIYLDGILVGRQQIAPGTFDLRNIYSYTGSHEVEVVLKDPFGKEQRIAYPVYFTIFMLREGLHEYSYTAGFLRQKYGVQSDEYGKSVFSAFHRYGVTNSLNVGANAEGSDGVYNGGVSTSFLLPRLGAFALAYAASDANGVKGNAALFQHTYQLGSFNTNLRARFLSRDYATVAAPAASAPEQTKHEITVGGGYFLMPVGSISLNYSAIQTYGIESTRIISANYSRTLSRAMSLFATLSETRQKDSVTSFFIGLNFSIDEHLHGAAQYARTGDTHTETVQLQKDVPVGEGLGYRATLNRTDTGSATTNSMNPYVQYNGPYGIYSVDANLLNTAGSSREAYTLAAAGSLVYAGGFYGVSRPVSDSFSMVMLDKVENATVLNNGQEIGTTSSSGTVIVPTLTSYGQNLITVDVKNLPMEYSISGVNKALSPSLWSGSCIAFDAVRMQAVTGNLSSDKNGKNMPLEYVEITLRAGGKELTYPTGKNGEFYVENTIVRETAKGEDQLSCAIIAERRKSGGMTIPPGVYPASVDVDGKKCVFQITFPANADVITDLGEIHCVIQQEDEQKPAAAQPATENAAPVPVPVPVPAPEPAPPARPAVKAPERAEDNPPYSVAVDLRFDKRGNIADIKDRKAVATLVRYLKKNPGLFVAIEVHGDRHGTPEASRRLGLKKADALRKYLISSGVKAEKIGKVESLGSAGMLCTEATPECDKNNRRGVIKLVSADAAAQGRENKQE